MKGTAETEIIQGYMVMSVNVHEYLHSFCVYGLYPMSICEGRGFRIKLFL